MQNRFFIVGLLFVTLMVSIVASGVLITQSGIFGGSKVVAGSDDLAVIKQVVVRQGDTLWSIAKEHGPDHKDVRIIVDRIRELNDLDDAWIKPGMMLHVPGV